MRTYKQQGFTLLEISIVLVIIGLVVGGIIAGSEMIKQAEVRVVISETEQFTTAVTTFRNKYDCLPGDCPVATKLWGQWSDCGNSGTLDGTTCDGDGDGLVGVPYVSMEAFTFWQQLGLANLVGGSYCGFTNYNGLFNTNCRPQSRLRGIPYAMQFQDGDFGFIAGGHHYYQLVGVIDSGLSNYNPLTPEEAYAIDSKMDDGMPGQGRARIVGGPTYTSTTCVTSDDPLLATYDIANHGKEFVCGISMFFDAGF